jgi:hypothetical protein
LRRFYQALFEHAGTNNVTLQLELSYEYSINPVIENMNIRLPVSLMPPTETAIHASGSGTSLTEVIAKQVNVWETWFNSHNPETEGGKLIFDLTVISDLMTGPMPLLKLTELYLSLTDLNGHENVADKANN